jgi:hypothetical protein
MIPKMRKEIRDEWMFGRTLRGGEVEGITEGEAYRTDILGRVPAGKAGQ